jgi:DNA-binding NarL/FixJ family response regulator
MPDEFARNAVSALHRAGAESTTGLTLLTEREREILAYAAAGRGNKEIADRLCLSLDTVKTHLHHIYQKLGVTGRVEAILLYLKTK